MRRPVAATPWRLHGLPVLRRPFVTPTLTPPETKSGRSNLARVTPAPPANARNVACASRMPRIPTRQERSGRSASRASVQQVRDGGVLPTCRSDRNACSDSLPRTPRTSAKLDVGAQALCDRVVGLLLALRPLRAGARFPRRLGEHAIGVLAAALLRLPSSPPTSAATTRFTCGSSRTECGSS